MGESLNGVLAPVLTPFQPGLDPDPRRFVAFCRGLMAEGLGLAPFGTTSEGNSLSVDEKIQLLDALAGAKLHMGRMMPGTGCCALSDTIRLTRHAVAAGCGGVLMLPPFYYKGVSDDAVFRSFAEVIEQVGDHKLKVYLYHFPKLSQVPLSLSLITRLRARYPDTVVGIKDSSGEWDNMAAMIKTFPGFQVFTGTESLMLKLLMAGGAGCISANANVNGPAMVELYHTWRGPGAEAKQQALSTFRTAMEGLPLIPALKAIVARRTGDPGWRATRPPLLDLAPELEAGLPE